MNRGTNAPESQSAQADALNWRAARNIFRAWEWLRILYNSLLIVLTGVLLAQEIPHRISLATASVVAIQGAIVANLCYFAGPLLEVYTAWLGWNPRWLRFALFAAGTLFAMLLASLTLWFLALDIAD